MKEYTEAELKQFAVDTVDGKVFTDRHIPNGEWMRMISVFMPLAIGGLGDVDTGDIGLIFEYLSEAGPRGINGMPTFTSCRLLTKSQTEIYFQYYTEYWDMKKQYMQV